MKVTRNNSKFGYCRFIKYEKEANDIMRILITGANGYLGQGIVKRILEHGHEVIATDISTEYIDSRAKTKVCDLFEVDNPYDYFDKPEILLHLAWRDGFVHYSNSHIDDLPKHYKFIKKMAESGINRIGVMGSVHEVGFYEGCVNENTPCNPSTPYGIAKNALRNLAEMVCKQNHIVLQWFRGYYIVGNSKYGSSIFSKIAIAAEEGREEFPFTMGQNQFDFIDYYDFLEQVATAVDQDETNGIINICSGYPEKLADRVERFIKDNNYKIKLKYGSFQDRPYDSKAIWGDNRKINEIMYKYQGCLR